MPSSCLLLICWDIMYLTHKRQFNDLLQRFLRDVTTCHPYRVEEEADALL